MGNCWKTNSVDDGVILAEYDPLISRNYPMSLSSPPPTLLPTTTSPTHNLMSSTMAHEFIDHLMEDARRLMLPLPASDCESEGEDAYL